MSVNKREGRIGATFENIHGDEAVVIDYVRATEVYIMFSEYPWEHKVEWSDLKKGYFKNVMKPLISGVGFVGGTEYKTKIEGCHTPAYKSWKNMIKRCYDKEDLNYSSYGGDGVFVEDFWHNFQNFAEWYYEEAGIREPKGLQLDKDILSPHGEMFYSRGTCCLIPSELNCAITECKRNSTTKIKGIRKLPSGKWDIRMTDTDKKFKSFGSFKNLNTAKRVWVNNKYEIVKNLCQNLYKKGLIKDKELRALSDKEWFYRRFFNVSGNLCTDALEEQRRYTTEVNEKIIYYIEEIDYEVTSKEALIKVMDKIKEDLECRRDRYSDSIFNRSKI